MDAWYTIPVSLVIQATVCAVDFSLPAHSITSCFSLGGWMLSFLLGVAYVMRVGEGQMPVPGKASPRLLKTTRPRSRAM